MGADMGAGIGADMGADIGADMGAGMGADTGAGMGAHMGAGMGAHMGAGMGGGVYAKKAFENSLIFFFKLCLTRPSVSAESPVGRVAGYLTIQQFADS